LNQHASGPSDSARSGGKRSLRSWLHFGLAALLLAGVILGLMRGCTPPGVAGEVFRNNLRRDIDATPLFYTELNSYMPGG
jgi:hypothetical protein